MPLNTQIVRSGEPLSMPNGWGQFHVAAMVIAAALEDTDNNTWRNIQDEVASKGMDKPEKRIGLPNSDVFHLASYHVIAATKLNEGEYTLKSDHFFFDPMDGEEFDLKEGDVLKAWRM
jgi:hypothetical protein